MESVSFNQVGIWLACCLLLLDFFFRYRAHQREEESAKEPNPPFHKEYASKAEHDALVAEVNARFGALNKDRRENVEKLHLKIDHLEQRTREATDDMRGEVKSDLEGVHDRITQLLASFSELKGAVTAVLKNSSHPFSK